MRPLFGKRRLRRALLVGSHHESREVLAWSLRASGWLVEEVQNGQAAVFAVALLAPDAVVMDLDLPLLDGLEATRLLKDLERTKRIPIVVCTHLDPAVAWIKARTAGCSAFLAKPCSPDQLRHVLHKLVDARRPRP